MNYQNLIQSSIIPPHIVPLAQKAAHFRVPILIQGEEGTGKEQIAKLIHYISEWRDYRFYKMDCRILTEDTFDKQIFNIFKEIDYGSIPATLYLKEVGYLGQRCQLNILELIEEGLLQNFDKRRPIKNVRIIASTSEDLKNKVIQRAFSEDLYNQLKTFSIFVPPLRERPEDLPKIAQYILEKYSKKMNIKKIDLSREVLSLLENYWWPGNLRELEQVIVKSAIYSNGNGLIEKDFFLKIKDNKNSFSSFIKRTEMRSLFSKEKSYPDDFKNLPISTFFIDFVHRIKNPLVSIKTFTQLLRDKFNDAEFKEQFYKVVTEDIQKIDSLLDALLCYIKINTPITKTNTVHLIIDDIIEKYNPQIKERQIRIVKKFESNLPETIIHEEQLRYIFKSLLQYALTFVPVKGSIGFLTRILNNSQETNTSKIPLVNNKRYVEICMVFTGLKKPKESLKNVLGIPGMESEEPIELELRLIKEIIQKNHGTMRFERDEKRMRTLIFLKIPMERRKVVYYLSPDS